MKNLVLGLVAILLVVSSNVHSQNPHFTRDYPGIPVISQNGDWWHLINNDLVPYDSMKSMGVRYFWNNITDKVPQMGLVANKGFKIIPVNITEDTTVYNWIGYYCDAKYTEWEAEGTDTINIGKATLERDLQKTIISTNGNYISTVPYAPASTILRGPYYYQEKSYMIKRTAVDTLFYNAEFKIKLERNLSYPSYDTTNDNPTDAICKLLITQSRVNTSTTPWYMDSVITIDSVVLYRSDFPVINQFITQLLRYDLSVGFPVSNQSNIPRYRASNIPPDSMGRFLRENIEFKVVWFGNPKYLLSVDKVTVYDERGAELYSDSLGTGVRLTIKNQIDQLLSYDSSVVGWHGIDEPFSIDNFEPIKIVAQIVRDNNKQLYLPFMGFWDGVWQNTYNPFGTNHLSPHKEFFMRTNGLVNIWQNFYMYDQPFKDTSFIDPVKFGTTGYKDINIRIVANNYALARSIDSLFGVSLQCSAQKNAQSDIRDPQPKEILYNANLALMYGARFFDLYVYFAQGDSASGWAFTGMVNGYEYTPKWYMWRDVLNKRLNGLMGQTLKTITPTEQYLNHTLSSSEGFIQSITKGGCTVQGMQPSDEAYDLGFFKDDLDRDYFMLISRWYNLGCNPALTINIKPEYFPDYYNLKVVNLINNTTLNTITKYGNIYTAPEVGDACFFSVAPIVKYGGLLAYNDTIKSNITLSDNMTIDAGKVLQINEGKTYTITDTITFTDTSSFITGYGYINCTQNGWITTRSWNKSLFKGRSGSHPKLIWSKHPDITNVIEYKIYRNHANGGWQYLTTKSSSIFEYIDSTITIIEGMSQANETSTQYRITATHRPTRDLVETSPTNTILYHRVEGQGLEKQNSDLLSNDFEYNLDQNYPNPFNPTTTINYSIEADGIVTLEILNILGERIKTLVNEFKTKGNHNISFNASSLASGVYVYKLQAGDFVSSKKMILLK